MTGRKLRFGMVGGGRGAFIGGVHRIVAQMDGQAELVAGAFSSDPQRSRDSAADLGIATDRAYGSYQEMAAAEAVRPHDERLDFVVIVTPNDQHFPMASLFLGHGFNVVCDKPATLTLAEAIALRDIVSRSGKLFALTHNYGGHAMVKQARAMVRAGELGAIRKVVVEYSQGWLARALEREGNKQAAWRTDPTRSGAAGCLGDIGVHAEHLARHVTGLRIDQVCAELTAFVPGRRLDDDANVLLRFEGGTRGVLHSSQVAVGEDNNLALRVYGSEAGLAWRQERPDELVVMRPDRPRELLHRGSAYLAEAARHAARLPPGHPEGYLEAFANLYREVFRAIAAEESGAAIPDDLDFPGIDDAVAGMAFVEAALASAQGGAVWMPVPGRNE